jgi:hypothetical protein
MNGQQGTGAEYGVYRSQTSTSASKHYINIKKLVHMHREEGRKEERKKEKRKIRKRNPAQTLFGDTDGRFLSGAAFSRRR